MEQMEQAAAAGAVTTTTATVATETLAVTAAVAAAAIDTSVHPVTAVHATSTAVGEKRKRDDDDGSEQLASAQQQLANAQQQLVSAQQQLASAVESVTTDLPLRDDSPHALGLKRDDALSQLGALQPLVPLAPVSVGGDAEASAITTDDAQSKREDVAAAPEQPAKRQYSFIPDGIKERAIVLVLQHKCSVSDVAEVMGVSRGALYKHIERARKQLDDAARARSKGDRRHMPPAAALKMDSQQSSSQMKALVAKLKTSIQKSAPPAAVARSSSLDPVSAATAAAVAAAASGASSVVL